MDDEGNAKKQKQSTSVGTAGNTSSASASASASGGECEVFLSFRGEDTRKGFTACIVEMFRLPCIVTAAVILLSLPVFSKLLKKRGKRTTTAVTTENTSSTSNCASDSSSASALGGEYEVFLSFRGEDTRKGFTDFLYNYLVDVGIRTFRDNEELHVGEEIGQELLKAIKESKISIPIFSKNYASSKWCLRELAQIVECQTTMGQKIFPIFYDVEPYDVRHQMGSYEKAFCEHKNSCHEKTVQGWKEALTVVGNLKGWELEKETYGHQGELAKMVVEQVLLELKKNYTAVTENLVGIDHRVKKMMEFLNVDSNDVQIVGIHGMGGIGKTTIAKVIYNQLPEHFECCCFLEDVRETSKQHKGLVNLQNQLISMILKGKCPNIVDVNDGINMIKDKVCRKKALIVLDDVDEKSQFDKLAGKRDWYGLGSRIIVTTRNEEVLIGLEVDKTYKPPSMKPDHSLQLFSKHAFRRDSPLEDYDTLSREIVSTAAGLPLALEIIGSSLFLERKEVWNDTLMKLKEIPDEKVQEKLRISYEALDYGQKQIFLDIACFFIGEDKINPFYMWDDCNFFPTIGIKVLVRRSLVKIGDDNQLMMHDQLRDLGREIVRKENFQEPRERSRLWRHEEALNILKSRMGTRKVVALCLKPSNFSEQWSYNCFTNKEFAKLPNLRFLRVDYAGLAGDFENLLSNLRWLRWQGCPANFTATNFYLKNLVILDLSHSNITEDWEGWSQIKMATKLKVLNLSHCWRLTRTPDFSTFASLERLILSECISLDQIDPSIGNLINLRMLDISETGITKLPDAIGNLEKLEEIDASDCSNLKCIPGLPSSLFKLCLTSCESVERLPDLSNLKKLSELMLHGCYELMEIQGLGKLELLTCLNVSWCGKLTKLDGLEQLESLTYLNTSNCESLERLPDLTFLGSSISKSNTASFLNVSRGFPLAYSNRVYVSRVVDKFERILVWKQTKLDGLEQLESLTYLNISNCESLERLPDLSNLSWLEHLEVQHCSILKCIPGLPSCLFKLCLSNCSELMEIHGLGKLELLTSLDVSWCPKLTKLDGLPSSLFKLCLTGFESVERLPDLSNLKNLSELMLDGCHELMEIQGLGKLELLTSLGLSQCGKLTKLNGLPSSLFKLCLTGCEPDKLESLKYLDMGRCISIERLSDLSNLGMLKELKLSGCQQLAEVEGLWVLESLEKLDVSWCISLERSLDLSKLKILKELKIRGWKNLTEIRGLEELESLELLDIAGCKLIETLPDLSNLKNLEELNVFQCEKLTEIQGLEELKSLKLLDIFGCKSIENLPHLPNTNILTDS